MIFFLSKTPGITSYRGDWEVIPAQYVTDKPKHLFYTPITSQSKIKFLGQGGKGK